MLTIQCEANPQQVPPRAKLRRWASAALKRNAQVTLRIVGAREARTLNRRYRNKDYATNVLTFIYEGVNGGRRPLTGDIALCAPVVVREALAQGISRDAHYAHLVVHGMLHLQGHDHQKATDTRRMERLETLILERLGFADPYAAS